jgi:hypothetical protein
MNNEELQVCCDHSNLQARSTCGLRAEGEKAATKVIYQSRSMCGLGAKVEKSDPNEERRVASV